MECEENWLNGVEGKTITGIMARFGALLSNEHVQPALLYLVPCTLGNQLHDYLIYCMLIVVCSAKHNVLLYRVFCT
uniref:Uncharacterized protein n=1 Tax=Rhizophora mucronata TaxID=61149 RepID=A0A2P2PYK3_RHIMU